MKVNLRKLGIFLALTAVLLFGMFLIAVPYIDIGLAALVGGQEKLEAFPDILEIPESVVEDATATAMELYGNSQDKYDEYVKQLLEAYVEVKDQDFVVIFNPGGWGTKILESSPGWCEICQGITSELESLGYSSLKLDYRRTTRSIRGLNKELVELFAVYPSKATNLAGRVEFLTKNVPDLKIIMAGESNGTVISDAVMARLQDNPRVYSIQTGPPFWHKQMAPERTLVLDTNGRVPDAFSQGDIPAMLTTSLKALFGFSLTADEEAGRIFYFVRAPGHDYNWQYPDVNLKIIGFLEENFSADRQISHN
jgi:hypothetical protein